MKNDFNVINDTGIIVLKNGAGFKQNLVIQSGKSVYCIQIVVDDFVKDSYATLKILEKDFTFFTLQKKDLEKDFKLNLFEKIDLKKDAFKPVIDEFKKIILESSKIKEKLKKTIKEVER